MKIAVAAIGHMKSGPERELADRYFDRLAKSSGTAGLDFRGIAEAPESRARDAQTRKREEARSLAPPNREGVRLLAFDERGKPLTSAEFASMIGRWRDEGARSMHCLIGGADGLDEDLRQSADRIVSFGAMTLPHQLVRVLAAEQLYRAVTILTGHPYHRE